MKSKVKKKKDENLNFDYMKTTKDNIKNDIATGEYKPKS